MKKLIIYLFIIVSAKAFAQPCSQTIPIQGNSQQKPGVIFDDMTYFSSCASSMVNFKLDLPFTAIDRGGVQGKQFLKLKVSRIFSDGSTDDFFVFENPGNDFAGTLSPPISVTKSFNTPPAGQGIRIKVEIVNTYTSVWSDLPNEVGLKYRVNMGSGSIKWN